MGIFDYFRKTKDNSTKQQDAVDTISRAEFISIMGILGGSLALKTEPAKFLSEITVPKELFGEKQKALGYVAKVIDEVKLLMGSHLKHHINSSREHEKALSIINSAKEFLNRPENMSSLRNRLQATKNLIGEHLNNIETLASDAQQALADISEDEIHWGVNEFLGLHDNSILGTPGKSIFSPYETELYHKTASEGLISIKNGTYQGQFVNPIRKGLNSFEHLTNMKLEQLQKIEGKKLEAIERKEFFFDEDIVIWKKVNLPHKPNGYNLEVKRLEEETNKHWWDRTEKLAEDLKDKYGNNIEIPHKSFKDGNIVVYVTPHTKDNPNIADLELGYLAENYERNNPGKLSRRSGI